MAQASDVALTSPEQLETPSQCLPRAPQHSAPPPSRHAEPLSKAHYTRPALPGNHNSIGPVLPRMRRSGQRYDLSST